ncbi:hypothetical protein TPA0598_06_00120 [Streptomyces lydicamycinicus]|uniref:Uncharacterized protein n=1 Tax=Streptomyces lydicamycinicus TaxID=1546107 RepID=A0A0P4R8X6_9ACTN|nr:hypothetical protein TPA0598_06_00120 [Streptomyces lydicamycinicus]
MGNAWTRLTQEAGERGGPDALRAFYRAQGQKSAVAYMACFAAVSGVAYGVNKYRKYAEGNPGTPAADVPVSANTPVPTPPQPPEPAAIPEGDSRDTAPAVDEASG